MAYSKDLRIRAVSYFLGHSARYDEVASIFNVGATTLHTWVRKYQETGVIEAKKSPGRARVLASKRTNDFRDLVLNNADKTLSEISDKWHEITGQKLSVFNVSRSIRRLGLSLKKRHFVHQKGVTRIIEKKEMTIFMNYLLYRKKNECTLMKLHQI